VRGLPAAATKAPVGTPYTFQLVGDLTVKGVTRPATWNVTARRAGAGVTGSAATAFTFGDFGLTQPRVPVVLSVADTIRLQYDFTLAPAPASSSR
jgi:polyisoprenoid-binding protein YceI